MDTETHLPTRFTTSSTTSGEPPTRTSARVLLVGLIAMAVVGVRSPVIASSPDGDQGTGPDVVADHVGGIAARLHDADGSPIVGDVFLLIGSGSSATNARVYDSTPYTHDRRTHPDTVASNLLAARTVGSITGLDVEVIEMTNAAAGGPSGGLTRAIVYLNVVSGGEFTGDFRVAATGQLSLEGHVSTITDIDSKTVAAHLADADVLFTPTVPTNETLDGYAARAAGEFVRDPSTGVSLNDERRVELFHQWGASRPAGMDVIDVRHLIDVSSYLCGAGSAFACHVTEQLDQRAERRLDDQTDEAGSESDRFRSVTRQSDVRP